MRAPKAPIKPRLPFVLEKYCHSGSVSLISNRPLYVPRFRRGSMSLCRVTRASFSKCLSDGTNQSTRDVYIIYLRNLKSDHFPTCANTD